MGVRYVVLTTAPTDYSARGEARLLRRGHSGLTRVFRSATTSIYAVPSPRPIVTGPGRAQVLALRTSSLAFRVSPARHLPRRDPLHAVLVGPRRLHRAD